MRLFGEEGKLSFISFLKLPEYRKTFLNLSELFTSRALFPIISCPEIQWRGNYFRTRGGGGKDRERQSREREIMFFAGNGVFFIPKTNVLEKKDFAVIGVSFCP